MADYRGAPLTKDPDAERLVQFDWTKLLAAVTGTYVGHTIELEAGTGLTKPDGDGTHSAGVISVAIGGGTLGTTETVTCRLTYNTAVRSGLVEDATRPLIIEHQ